MEALMKWFKHDSDASIDAKLQILLLDYGAKGYGLYWYCVELIAQGVNENNITFELEHDARIIARNLNLSVQETKDMMEKMIELKLFSISQNRKLACYALAKRLDQSMTSNEKMRKLIADIKVNHDAVMTKSIEDHDKVMQEEKRIEEIREEENRTDENKESVEKKPKRFIPPTLEEIDTFIKTNNLNVNAKYFLDYFTDGNWVDSKGNKVKNWKQKLRTWHNHNDSKPKYRTLADSNREAMDAYEKRFNGDVIEGEVCEP